MNIARMKIVCGEVARRLFDLKSKGRPYRNVEVRLTEVQVADLLETAYQAGHAAGIVEGRTATLATVGKALGLRP